MIRSKICKFAGVQFTIFCMVLSLLVLPASHVSAATQEIKEVKVLEDQKKKGTDQIADIDTNETSGEENTGKKEDEQGKVAGEQSQGLSTGAKIGIGVGVVALVGLALVAGGGGSSGSSAPPAPTYPTTDMLLGVWNAQGTRLDGGSSYTGIYTLYNFDVHTYAIAGQDYERRTGGGRWSLALDSYSLTISNDTGSTYKGDFINEDYSTITLTTTDGRWRVVLTR
jgi:hypothetical protein